MNAAMAFATTRLLGCGRATTALIALWTLLGMTNASYSETPATDPVIAIVNGTQVHESDLAVVDLMMGRNITSMEREERRESVLSFLIDAMLLAQIAKDRNIIDQADVDRRITFARNQGLADHLLIVVGKDAVTDEAEHKLYDEISAKTPVEPEVHLRQIFFRITNGSDETAVKAVQDKAEVALKRLRNGEDFAKVYADVSDDRATAPNGGDQGWHARGELGKEIFDAAAALKVGEVSPLFKTAAGLHIIKLEDRRDRKPRTFEQVKGLLAGILVNKARRELIDKARESAKIERMDTAKASPKSD